MATARRTRTTKGRSGTAIGSRRRATKAGALRRPIAPRSFLYAVNSATGVATLTLNRPERLNALTFEVYAELRDTFRALDTEPGVRAIVLTGAGRGFCSGGDVEDIIGALFARDSAGLREFTRMTCDVILNLRRCRRPVIAALNGTVAGAGAVIAAACDFRIAAESAKIAFLFVRVGLSGADMGASWLLPRLVGLGRATEMLMTGEFMDARRALEIGLYHRVVAQDRVLAEATELAEKLARGPGDALAVTKHALDDEAHLDLERALAYEADVQAGLMEHPDYREAYEAFRAKREPRFQR
jgi:enoyl-CoA hydratase/carnithine racemase